jgi:hypothetical protein
LNEFTSRLSVIHPRIARIDSDRPTIRIDPANFLEAHFWGVDFSVNGNATTSDLFLVDGANNDSGSAPTAPF